MTERNFEKPHNTLTLPDDENLYDLSMIEELDDEEYVVEMINVFLKETPVDLREMREALNAGKTETICKQAHKLKNSAGVIQANRLMDLLTGIEKNAKAGKVNVELIALVTEVHQQHQKIEYGLKNHLKIIGQ